MPGANTWNFGKLTSILKMDFDFYLSEMSVSDLHGGGLTLQRILGDDLMRIPYFAYVNRTAFDIQGIDKIRDREIDLTSFWDGNTARKILGNTFARSTSRNSFILKKEAKRSAKLLTEKFQDKPVLNAIVCPQGPASIYTLEALKRYRTIKYISWVMDDHIVKYSNGEWVYPEGMEQLMKKHLREAEHVFVISPEMQNFYRNRFGIESTVLFGPFDSPDSNVPELLNDSDPLKIGYFGAVAAWQLDALQCVVKALSGTNVQLHIYSTIEKLPADITSGNVYFEGRIGPNQVLIEMRKYNAILLPISFTEARRNMSEFNIATKMSEYLASGIPILAVGPQYAAMVNYLKTNNAAIVVDNCKEEDIKNAFTLLNDQSKIAVILNNAKKLELTETGTLPMRERWLKGINKTSSE